MKKSLEVSIYSAKIIKTRYEALPLIIIFLFLHWVSLVRPAPAEFPQDRKVARVGGRSGAIPDLTLLYLSVFTIIL